MNRRHLVSALSIATVALASSCSSSGPSAAPAPTATTPTTAAAPEGTVPSITGDTPCPAADGSSPITLHFEKAPPRCIDPAKSYSAKVETTAGTFTIQLDSAHAPNNVNNFVVLARYHYFDGLPFDQNSPGDYTGTGSHLPPAGPDPGYRIPIELPSEVPVDKAAYQQPGTVIIDSEQTDDDGSIFIVLLTDKGVAPRFTILGRVSEDLAGARAVDTAVTEATSQTPSTGTTGTSNLPTIVRMTITES